MMPANLALGYIPLYYQSPTQVTTLKVQHVYKLAQNFGHGFQKTSLCLIRHIY